MKKLFDVVRNKKGQGLVEYALILVLIGIATVSGLKALQIDLVAFYQKAASEIAHFF